MGSKTLMRSAWNRLRKYWKTQYKSLLHLPALSVILCCMIAPVAAQTNETAAAAGECPLRPIIDLLNSFISLALTAGGLIAVLGFAAAGIMIVAPLGPEWTSRGKELFKHVLLGCIILFSSRMIVQYLLNALVQGAVCGGV